MSGYARLMETIAAATQAHTEAVSAVIDAALTQTGAELEEMNAEAEGLLQSVESAWEAYYCHIREHGCRFPRTC